MPTTDKENSIIKLDDRADLILDRVHGGTWAMVVTYDRTGGVSSEHTIGYWRSAAVAERKGRAWWQEHNRGQVVGFEVVCPDGEQRHSTPFTTKGEAEAFAEWGHACLRGDLHTFTEVLA